MKIPVIEDGIVPDITEADIQNKVLVPNANNEEALLED